MRFTGKTFDTNLSTPLLDCLDTSFEPRTLIHCEVGHLKKHLIMLKFRQPEITMSTYGFKSV